MVSCSYEADRRVYANETRFIRAFERGSGDDIPSWIQTVRVSSNEEDHQMIDVCIETDVGTFFCQIKSSTRGKQRFEEQLRSRISVPEIQFRYFCIVVTPDSPFQGIRREAIQVLSEKRTQILRDQAVTKKK